jgi:BirA family biotin operon repressor/biotin-[acetyl-CoA-carboxylase] ligase
MSGREKLSFGHRIVHLDSIDSTNNYAAKLCAKGELLHGSVILADEQTCGRGQRDSIWESSSGENVLLTAVAEPANLSVSKQFLLSQLTALSVSGVIRRLGMESTIKWPNDIYLNQHKIAGILIENTLRLDTVVGSLFGIGINVNQLEFKFPLATSIRKETGKFYQIMDIVYMLMSELNHWWEMLLGGQQAEIQREYLGRLYKRDELTWFSDQKGLFEGIIKGVDETGKLLVEGRGQLLTYDLKEITFLRSDP